MVKTASIADLYATSGKAELAHGRLIQLSPTGFLLGFAADEIYSSLRLFARTSKLGYAVADGKGFLVDLPHRQSFSPDAAFILGSHSGMKFFDRAPTFAVEVRSEHDYGKTAEREIAAKITDYFAAGTLAVWDVDLLAQDVVRLHLADSPVQVFTRGELAHAGTAVPDWSMPVEDLFPYYVPFAESLLE
jgi:Uma2 family endonuclease